MLAIPLMVQTFIDDSCSAEEHFYHPYNVSRSTISGIEAYRSALTLDWLAAEDNRQRDMVKVFETESPPPPKMLATDCISYSRPASGKIARLMLELLKNLEGDEGMIIPDLIQSLVRAKLLVETSMLESEPDLEALLRTPDVMMGEPHITFPRILAMTWMVITDPITTKKYGWCPVSKITKYVSVVKPNNIAKHIHALEPIVARARFIMEEFIQHVTPIMYEKTTVKKDKENSYGQKLNQRRLGRLTKTSEKDRKAPISMPKFLNTELSSQQLADLIAKDAKVVNDKTVSRTHMEMEPKFICYVLLWLSIMGSSESIDLDIDSEFSDDRWVFRNSKREDMSDLPCGKVHPTPRDIVRRFYAILPYFDKDHSNRAFLHKFRATVYGMSEGDDILDREAAFYASALTPLLFLQQYRDTWCLLERFHRAMRLYQLSHPAEKRAALKLLQNLRAVNQKIKSFIFELPGPEHASRSTTFLAIDDDEIHDKKDIRYLKELIKNLG
ncbi:hypothetical protein K1T71_011887 [Dendrolimus kikuchii]|uniref:Uncharacterized protein n=1 Tax=Dendrolimus kikuchii TaxID=765133 RepID=A0ACC1CMD8_9NEOP|nr:hypothetical protein K1T71_011887 [Dendrolimus kikuchii]